MVHCERDSEREWVNEIEMWVNVVSNTISRIETPNATPSHSFIRTISLSFSFFLVSPFSVCRVRSFEWVTVGVCVCVSEIHALIHIKRIRLCEHCNLLYRCNKQSWIYLNWLQPNHWKTPKNNETMKSPNQRCRIQPFESAKLEQYLRIKIIMLAAWFVASQKLCIELRPLHFHRKYTHTPFCFFPPSSHKGHREWKWPQTPLDYWQ